MVLEPSSPLGRPISNRASEEVVVEHWRDTMVERSRPDGAAYVTGWTISGLAIIATIVAVWLLGI